MKFEKVDYGKKLRDYLNSDIDQMYKNMLLNLFPELGESEDESIKNWCISHFMECFRVSKDNAEYQEYLNNKVIPWLEKQGEKGTNGNEREIPNSAWSGDDERIIDNLVSQLGNLYARKLIKEETKDKYVNWLKSLKERYTWKPSDEQLNTLWDAIFYVERCNSNFKGSGSVLENLYKDLKKLREE